MELPPEPKSQKIFVLWIVQNNSKEIFFWHFSLVNKRGSSCSDVQPHIWSILGDTNTLLYHCSPRVVLTLTIITVLLILLVSALKLNLHLICMKNLHSMMTLILSSWLCCVYTGHTNVIACWDTWTPWKHRSCIGSWLYANIFNVCPFLAIYNI